MDNLLFDVELDGEVLVMDNIDWSGSNVYVLVSSSLYISIGDSLNILQEPEMEN